MTKVFEFCRCGNKKEFIVFQRQLDTDSAIFRYDIMCPSCERGLLESYDSLEEAIKEWNEYIKG